MRESLDAAGGPELQPDERLRARGLRARGRAASTPGSLTDLAGSRERTLLFRAVAVACGARAACFLVAFLTITLVPVKDVSSLMRTALAEPFPATSMLAHILHPWAHWDGVWYIRITSQGYVPKGSTAFFPPYPLALRVTAPIVDHNYVVAGILLSLAFYAAASVLLFKLVSSDFTPETAFWTVLFLAVSPASFFFQAVYTASLFLLATVACFYFARQHRWAFAGLAGMAATLTRSSGLVLLVPLVVLYMQQRDWRWRRIGKDAGWMLLIPAGLGVWMAYLGLAFGNPLRFAEAETLWNRHFTFPLVTLWRGMLGFEKAASHLLPRGWGPPGLHQLPRLRGHCLLHLGNRRGLAPAARFLQHLRSVVSGPAPDVSHSAAAVRIHAPLSPGQLSGLRLPGPGHGRPALAQADHSGRLCRSSGLADGGVRNFPDGRMIAGTRRADRCRAMGHMHRLISTAVGSADAAAIRAGCRLAWAGR